MNIKLAIEHLRWAFRKKDIETATRIYITNRISLKTYLELKREVELEFHTHQSAAAVANKCPSAKIEEIMDDTVACKKCNCKVSELALFPGGICITCHELKFNEQVKANGGALPRPNFFKAISK